MDYNNIDYNDLEFYSLMTAGEKHEAILESEFPDDMFKVSAGEVTYTKTIATKIAMGKRQCDMLAFNDGVNKVLSDEIIALLKQNNITGWKTYPVEIRGVKKSYHGFQVTGRSGELIEPEKQSDDDFSYTGVKFDPESWDGSDIFFPMGTNLPIITKKLRDILLLQKFSNLEVKHIKEFNGYF